MKSSDISALRLTNQLVGAQSSKTPREVVKWLGALQAQDYPMVKWALGKRAQGSTEHSVEAAIANGDILRTHVLRPTWHLVSPGDLRWMLELTAPCIKSSMKGRHKELELADTVIRKTNRIIEKTLSSGRHLTRDEIAVVLNRARISTKDNNRLSHILLSAELDRVICSGVPTRGKQTYALFDERVSGNGSLTREESLATLAVRYFTSRGPATVGDFQWWSGLPVGAAREAIELAKPHLVSHPLGEILYWSSSSKREIDQSARGLHLLPAFDEYLIAYRDRSAVLTTSHLKRAVSTNGIFRPIIVVDGKVCGLWKRRTERQKVIVEFEFFVKPEKRLASSVGSECHRLERFLGKPVEFDLPGSFS